MSGEDDRSGEKQRAKRWLSSWLIDPECGLVLGSIRKEDEPLRRRAPHDSTPPAPPDSGGDCSS